MVLKTVPDPLGNKELSRSQRNIENVIILYSGMKLAKEDC
jgi:hypothetical protein